MMPRRVPQPQQEREGISSTIHTIYLLREQAYERKLKEVSKKRNVEVLAIPSNTRGRPPILLEIDAKFHSLKLYEVEEE